ncbi:MAG: hypothetical protein HYV07_33465 [Deltaproteobacteria bacterium]|nr:hypothetical protein [Deltaproteobacteria bacterium]
MTLIPALAAGAPELLFEPAAMAPATIVLTATVGAEVPIAFDWGVLETAPRCRGARCELRLDSPTCERVKLEISTLEGAPISLEGVVCAGDAPEAKLELAATEAGIDFLASAKPASSPLGSLRLYVDGRLLAEPQGALPRDGACHAVDVVAIDELGGVGLDRRSVCTGNGPRVWVGSSQPSPVDGAGRELCVEALDPLGRKLVSFSEGCRPGALVRGLLREVIAVGAERGPTSFGSLVTIPAEGAFVLEVDAKAEGLIIRILGGRAPFGVEATLDAVPIEGSLAGRTFTVPGELAGALVVDVRDANGRVVSYTSIRGVALAASADSSSGCSATGRSTLWTLLLLMSWLRARSGGSR